MQEGENNGVPANPFKEGQDSAADQSVTSEERKRLEEEIREAAGTKPIERIEAPDEKKDSPPGGGYGHGSNLVTPGGGSKS